MRVGGGAPPLLRVPNTPAAACSHLPHADGAGANQAVRDTYQLRRVVWDAAWQRSGQVSTAGHVQACMDIACCAVRKHAEPIRTAARNSTQAAAPPAGLLFHSFFLLESLEEGQLSTHRRSPDICKKSPSAKRPPSTGSSALLHTGAMMEGPAVGSCCPAACAISEAVARRGHFDAHMAYAPAAAQASVEQEPRCRLDIRLP